MPIGEIGFTVWALFVFVTSIGLLIFGVRTRQFDNFEQIKYQVLEDKEPVPWPGREARAKGQDEGKGANPGQSGR